MWISRLVEIETISMIANLAKSARKKHEADIEAGGHGRVVAV